MSKNKETNTFGKIFAFLGGFHVAVISMAFLLVLTWLSTLEQGGPGGLYWTMKKYFGVSSYYVQPTLYGHDLPLILPGGYWVCVVFTINLIVGGVLRIRKGWKHAAVLISHFSMVVLMIGGAVSYHQSREAYMALDVGSTGDYAFSLTDLSIEVSELKDGKRQKPLVLNSEILSAVRGKPKKSRDYILPKDYPFDITVSKYFVNAQLYPQRGTAPEGAVVVDGYYVMEAEPTGFEERNLSSCLLSLVDKETGKGQQVLLYEGIEHDVTATINGKVYGFRLHGEIWNLPYKIQLDGSRGEKHPGTGMAMVYESDVTTIDDNGNKEKMPKIEMNKPLRHQDLTIYQTSWDDSGPKVRSGFTVKTNPSDQWPKYAIIVSGCALFVHFIIKLFGFASTGKRKHSKEQK